MCDAPEKLGSDPSTCVPHQYVCCCSPLGVSEIWVTMNSARWHWVCSATQGTGLQGPRSSGTPDFRVHSVLKASLPCISSALIAILLTLSPRLLCLPPVCHSQPLSMPLLSQQPRAGDG